MSVIPTVAVDGVGVVSAGQLNAYELSCYNTGVLRGVVGQTGMTAYLQGTNVPNDGGQGTFYWDYTTTATDNNLTVIRPWGVVYGAWLRTSLAGDASNTTVTTQGGTTARTLANHLADILNVKDFGAVGNGTTDDTSAIQSAITYAESLGASLWFDPGTYLIAGQLILHNVNLCGPGTYRSKAAAGDYGDDSAVLWLTSTTQVPLLINNNGGVNINGLVFYWPNQSVNTTPIAYPALISGAASTYVYDLTVSNCVVINAYDFMTRAAAQTDMGDIRVTNCRIYAIHNVFTFLGKSAEAIFVDSCIFSPGVYHNVAVGGYSGYLNNWTSDNGSFLYSDPGAGNSIDGFSISNSLVYGYRWGLKLLSGGSYAFQSTGTTWDRVAQLMYVNGYTYVIGAQFTGGDVWCERSYLDTVNTSSGIYINSTYIINILFSGVTFSACAGHLFEIASVGASTDPGSAITVQGGNINSWGRNLSATADAYALYAHSVNAVITFQPGTAYNDVANGNGVHLSGALKAIISGSWWNTKYFLVSDVGFTGKSKLSNLITVGSQSTNLVINSAAGTVEAGQGCYFDAANPTYGWPIIYLYDSNASTTTYTAGPTTVTFGGTTPQKIEGITYSAGVITVGSTGYYRWDVSLSNAGTTATGTQYKIYVETGGSNVRQLGVLKTFTNTYVDSAVLSGSAYFITGDTMKVVVERISASGSWTTIANGTLNYITVAKLA